MSVTVLLLCAEGDEDKIEWLDTALRDAGYGVVHHGTVAVGESFVEEFERELARGCPVVLYGTRTALGDEYILRTLNSVKSTPLGPRIFPVLVEPKTAIYAHIGSDIKIVDCISEQKRAAGIVSLLESLGEHYPLNHATVAPDPLAGWNRLAGDLAKNALVLSLCSAFERGSGVRPFLETIGAAADIAQEVGLSVPSAPWSSAEWPCNVITQLDMLCSRLGDTDRLEPAEIALLLVAPFVVHRLIEGHVAELRTLDAGSEPPPITTDYGRFLSGRQRLVDLARDEVAESVSDLVRGWLRLRFAEDSRRFWREVDVDRVLSRVVPSGDLHNLFNPGLFIHLLRASALEPKDVKDLPESRPVRILGRTIVVRWRLLGTLLLLAERTTLRPGLLSDTILHHLGVRRGLPFEALCQDVSDTWFVLDGEPPVLTLHAACHAPASEHALRELTHEIDRVVRDEGSILHHALRAVGFRSIHRCDVSVAARKQDGRDRYVTPLVRFEMDPDDVRELLMGTQLWGDPGLAFREMYQNALDACRYRRCRSQFQRVKYEPHIRFHDGVTAEGRRYVECEDNGIGMTREFIRTCFARAGRRFATTTEFRSEQAEWKTRGIEMTPNSQFGIGVFSYFLVADEIEVETCRLCEDAHTLEERLLVRIPTASSLFTIEVLPSGIASDARRRRLEERGEDDEGLLEAGTRVRLYLSPRAIGIGKELKLAQEVLQELVWFTEIAMRATAAGRPAVEWDAGHLASWIRPFAEEAEGESQHWWTLGAAVAPSLNKDRDRDRFFGTSRGWALRVLLNTSWDDSWFPYDGRVLADGILTRNTVPCAIVNLTKTERPTLSVDRTEVRSAMPQSVLDRFGTAVPQRLNDHPLQFEWLYDLWLAFPTECAALLDRAQEMNFPWVFNNLTQGSRERRFFPGDMFLFESSLQRDDMDRRHRRHRRPEHDCRVYRLWRAVYWGNAWGTLGTHRTRRTSDSGWRRIDPRLMKIWASRHAGCVEAAALAHLTTDGPFTPATVLFSSWLTNRRPIECKDLLDQLAEVLDLMPVLWDSACLANADPITDAEARLLGHQEDANWGDFYPWTKERFRPGHLLEIAMATRRDIRAVADDIARLSSKLGWEWPTLDLVALGSLAPFSDSDVFFVDVLDSREASGRRQFEWHKGEGHPTMGICAGGPEPTFETNDAELLRRVQRLVLALKLPHTTFTLYEQEPPKSSEQEPPESAGASPRYYSLDLASMFLGSSLLGHDFIEHIDDIRQANAAQGMTILPASEAMLSEAALAAISRLDATDRRLLSVDLDGRLPMARPSSKHLVHASAALNIPLLDVARRLSELSRLFNIEGPAWDTDVIGTIGPVVLMDEALVNLVERAAVDAMRASIPSLIAVAVEFDEPLFRVHERLVCLAPILGYLPPADDATYLDLVYGDLVEQSRRV